MLKDSFLKQRKTEIHCVLEGPLEEIKLKIWPHTQRQLYQFILVEELVHIQ